MCRSMTGLTRCYKTAVFKVFFDITVYVKGMKNTSIGMNWNVLSFSSSDKGA